MHEKIDKVKCLENMRQNTYHTKGNFLSRFRVGCDAVPKWEKRKRRFILAWMCKDIVMWTTDKR